MDITIYKYIYNYMDSLLINSDIIDGKIFLAKNNIGVSVSGLSIQEKLMRSHQPFYQDIMGYNGLYTHIFDGGYDGGQREALQIGGLQHSWRV